MKKTGIISLMIMIVFCAFLTHAQDGSVSISETMTNAHESSILDVSSTTKGVLVPRMTTNQRTGIATPANGLLVFDTDEGCFYFYNDTDSEWNSLCDADASGDSWLILGNSGTDSDINFLGTLDAEPLVFRTDDNPRMYIFENGQIAVNNDAPFTGVVFNSFAGGDNDAIAGEAVDGAAIVGQNVGDGEGVLGLSNGTGDAIVGVHLEDGDAVVGISQGDGAGVYAENIDDGDGLYGVAHGEGVGTVAANTGTGRAIEAAIIDPANTNMAFGVFHEGNGRVANFQSQLTTNTEMVVFASQNSTEDVTDAPAIWAQSDNPRSGVFLSSYQGDATIALNAQYIGNGEVDALGVLGMSIPEEGWGVGVHGEGGHIGTVGIGDDFGVVGEANDPLGWGLYTFGDIGAVGTKDFVIDHPFDPENMILRHSAIESNEILNHYRGNIELDNDGKAIVELPHYFEEININFSYHLTPIGAPAPYLYVSKEVQGNKFKIAGGEPGMKVSWTVQAERNDRYMQVNPEKRNMEVEKNERMRGKYLDHRSWNMPVEKSVFAPVLNRKENKEKMKENEKRTIDIRSKEGKLDRKRLKELD